MRKCNSRGDKLKKEENLLFKYLKDYFIVYLPKQKNYSPHTLNACKHTWNIFLKFIKDTTNIKLDKLNLDDITKQKVIEFLDKMEKERKWSISTRNHRLACIRSFFKYLANIEPIFNIYLENLKGIPLKRDVDKSHMMEFMSQDVMKILLQQPDTSTKVGIRDLFFMVLMYDTAARDCEMLGMRFCDFNEKDKTVYLIGKGSKPRLVPITEDTVNHFKRYANIFHQNKEGNSPMFYTIHRNERTQMSDDNVARFMNKYGIEAKKICPEVPNKVHPHMFRRSRAMHLYRSGMPLAILSEWLGHSNLETTLIYAYADTEMKRKAIEKATENNELIANTEIPIWENNDDIIEKLCGLD